MKRNIRSVAYISFLRERSNAAFVISAILETVFTSLLRAIYFRNLEWSFSSRKSKAWVPTRFRSRILAKLHRNYFLYKFFYPWVWVWFVTRVPIVFCVISYSYLLNAISPSLTFVEKLRLQHALGYFRVRLVFSPLHRQFQLVAFVVSRHSLERKFYRFSWKLPMRFGIQQF